MPNKEEDEPLKENDHLMDALRYALYNYNPGLGEISLIDDGGYFSQTPKMF